MPHIPKYVLNFVISPLKTNLCLSMLGNTQNRVVLASFILFPSPVSPACKVLSTDPESSRLVVRHSNTAHQSITLCALKGKSINCILYMPRYAL